MMASLLILQIFFRLWPTEIPLLPKIQLLGMKVTAAAVVMKTKILTAVEMALRHNEDQSTAQEQVMERAMKAVQRRWSLFLGF
jgi:hypothetical protein